MHTQLAVRTPSAVIWSPRGDGTSCHHHPLLTWVLPAVAAAAAVDVPSCPADDTAKTGHAAATCFSPYNWPLGPSTHSSRTIQGHWGCRQLAACSKLLVSWLSQLLQQPNNTTLTMAHTATIVTEAPNVHGWAQGWFSNKPHHRLFEQVSCGKTSYHTTHTTQHTCSVTSPGGIVNNASHNTIPHHASEHHAADQCKMHIYVSAPEKNKKLPQNSAQLSQNWTTAQE